MFYKVTTVGRLKEGDRILLDLDGVTTTATVTKKMRGTRDYLICFEKIEGYPLTHMRLQGKEQIMKMNKGWDVKEENGIIVYSKV